ncbi:MAG: hypothetical protein R2764_01435 [Bacteroidales bacterium]
MQTIRYTGEDIPVDILMKQDDGSIINPGDLAGIKIYVVDQAGIVLVKAAEPAEEGYEPLILNDTYTRLWLQSAFTAELANSKLHFEVAIYETEDNLEDNVQTTIALSDKLIIKNAQIKEEEATL